jgi:DNA (cytosine-5)-methyltransferase 1
MPRIQVSSSVRAIDLFAGCGGFTLGAEMAGVRVVWAANHWPIAVRTHEKNHPNAIHECQDLMQKNWADLPSYDLLLASPACQGHSRASQPRRNEKHEAMRTTAWAVVECLEVTRPKSFLVENVEAFASWQLFDIWTSALRRLGYRVTTQTLDASRCGVPQRRRRLIVAGRLDREVEIRDLRTNEASFRECLDIEGDWRPIVLAGSDARDRMLSAASRHGGECLVQHVTGHRGISLDEPIRTITTKAQWCHVKGDRYRWLTPRELARGMGFPDSYWFPEDVSIADRKKLIGNAIPPLLAKTAIEQILN